MNDPASPPSGDSPLVPLSVVAHMAKTLAWTLTVVARRTSNIDHLLTDALTHQPDNTDIADARREIQAAFAALDSATVHIDNTGSTLEGTDPLIAAVVDFLNPHDIGGKYPWTADNKEAR